MDTISKIASLAWKQNLEPEKVSPNPNTSSNHPDPNPNPNPDPNPKAILREQMWIELSAAYEADFKSIKHTLERADEDAWCVESFLEEWEACDHRSIERIEAAGILSGISEADCASLAEVPFPLIRK